MGETQKKEKKKIGLTTKIFIALLAGAVFGIILCYAVPSGHIKDDIIVEGVLYSVRLCAEVCRSGIRRSLVQSVQEH